MYSRGAAAIAEQIHSTKEEAQQIVDDFYKSFPQVKNWMDDSLAGLKKNGYVEDFYGRRRRLPDIWLPNYTVQLAEPQADKDIFNPLLECEDRVIIDPRVSKWENTIKSKIQASQEFKRRKALEEGREFTGSDEMSNKQFTALAEEALRDGILLQANTGRKAQAERQCVNARIQGSSATMTKIAMVKLLNDEEMKSYGFKLCIGVHDELIGEVKEEYAEKGAARLCEIMKTCVADKMAVPFKCDPSIEKAWYYSEVAYQLQDTYKSMLKNGEPETKAIATLAANNKMFTMEEIKEFLDYED